MTCTSNVMRQSEPLGDDASILMFYFEVDPVAEVRKLGVEMLCDFKRSLLAQRLIVGLHKWFNNNSINNE
jgi:hypothetical protein